MEKCRRRDRLAAASPTVPSAVPRPAAAAPAAYRGDAVLRGV